MTSAALLRLRWRAEGLKVKSETAAFLRARHNEH